MSFVPLMTLQEEKSWKDKIHEALYREEGSYEERYRRANLIQERKRARLIHLAKERPHEYLAGLITMVSSKAIYGPANLDSAYRDFNPDEVSTYNTPEGRWWTDKFLEAVANMPLNYGVSAAVRYLRGIGKQASLKTPGVGLMSTSSGWKGSEVKRLGTLFFSTDFGAPCYDSSYIGKYSDHEWDEEEYGVLDEHDNPFAIMTAEKDLEFILELRTILQELGLQEPPQLPEKKDVSPRKIKKFQVGDKISKSNAKDLPPGSVIWRPGKTLIYRCHEKDDPNPRSNRDGTPWICYDCTKYPGFYHSVEPKLGYNKEYIWSPTVNKNGRFSVVLENPSEKEGSYRRIIASKLDYINGMTVKKLPEDDQ